MRTIKELSELLAKIAEIIDPMCWSVKPSGMTSNMLFRRSDALRRAAEILEVIAAAK